MAHLGDGEDGYALEAEAISELYDALGFAREGDEDEEIVLARRLIDGVELLAPCDLIDEDVVVDEEPLHLLHDIRLDIAGGIGKDAVRLADEAARTRVVAPHEFAPCLIIEAAERGSNIFCGHGICRLLHAHDRFHLTEAVKAELLCESHDGCTRHGARTREFVDGRAARRCTVALDVPPDAPIRVAEVAQMGIDSFCELHGILPPLHRHFIFIIS